MNGPRFAKIFSMSDFDEHGWIRLTFECSTGERFPPMLLSEAELRYLLAMGEAKLTFRNGAKPGDA